MKTFHSLLPSVPVGVLFGYSEDGISDEQLSEFAIYAEYVNPSLSMVNENLVERIHEKNLKIFPWTVRDQDSANLLLKTKVDGIITDYPDYVDPHLPNKAA